MSAGEGDIRSDIEKPMVNNWFALLANLAVGIVIAIVSARVTIHFALRRFYSEKWWERKVEAYSSIIESLHHMGNYAALHMEFAMRGSELPKDRDEELVANFKRAHAELRKRADVGTFVISEDAVDAIRDFEQNLTAASYTMSWHEHLTLENDAVSRCLESMRTIAKRDLGIQ